MPDIKWRLIRGVITFYVALFFSAFWFRKDWLEEPFLQFSQIQLYNMLQYIGELCFDKSAESF